MAPVPPPKDGGGFHRLMRMTKQPVSADSYLPSPSACERLEQIAVRFHGSVVTRPGETRVDYALPLHASAEIREFLRLQATARFASAYVARLPGGRVFGSGNVLSPDGRSIARDVSPDFGKAFEEHWLLTYPKIRLPLSIEGTTAVIATTLGSGYGHWLLEELPRLLALKPGDSDTLIAHATRACNREALALHGFSGDLCEAKRNAHFACEHLIVPSLGHLTPTTIRSLQEFVVPLHRSSSAFGERIYISREKARRRRVTNEAELWAALSSHGFVKLHLEELTWSQQLNAFRVAKVVVAPHGAGLANLVFCSPGTKVLEFFHRSYVNGCFWQLASLKELDYRPVVRSSAEPLAQILGANRLDLEVDVAQVVRVL